MSYQTEEAKIEYIQNDLALNGPEQLLRSAMRVTLYESFIKSILLRTLLSYKDSNLETIMLHLITLLKFLFESQSLYGNP